MISCRHLAFALTVLVSATFSAVTTAEDKTANQTPPNVFPVGEFEQFDENGKLVSWQDRINQSTLTLIKDDSGNHILRVVQSEEGGTTTISSRLEIDPNWKSIRVSARVRSDDIKAGEAGHQNARVQLTFLDKDGKRVSYGRSPALKSPTDGQWVIIRADNTIPEKATTLGIRVGLIQSTGTVLFDDITVIVVERHDDKETEKIDPRHPKEIAVADKSGNLLPEGSFENLPANHQHVWLSLNASQLVTIEGNTWVRFKVTDPKNKTRCSKPSSSTLRGPSFASPQR